MSIEMETAACG